jgi:phenylpropionate dioxygenase-like ring-hydroxylating dioxygenase large terminal subunit
MLVRNAWYVAATAEEVPAGKLLARMLLEEPVILFRTADGSPAALEDRCCHRNAPLSIGQLRNGEVECGYHGMRFDGTGRCVEVPSQAEVPPGARVKAYPVVERHRWVWIWMGEPARADASLIPDMFWHEDPGWVPIFGQFHVKCHYQNLIDIQLDQTHSPFVHPDSLASKAKLKVPPSLRREPGALHCERVYRNADAPELWAKAGNITGPANGWTRWEYRPPAAIMFDVGWEAVTPAPGAVPLRVKNSHAITPETATSSHHFWANARNFALDDPEVTRKLGTIRKTFSEDIGVVEATEANNARFPGAPIVHLQADAPTIQARRLVSALLDAEQGRRSA